MPESTDASRYIRSSFRPGDRIALLLIHRQRGAVIQRIGPSDKLASGTAQHWLAD